MPANQRPDISDILDGLRTGRLRQASAAALIEQRLTAQRRVMAHASPAMRSRVLKAVNDALGGGGQDEYSGLFRPSAPLGGGQPVQDGPLIYDTPDGKGKRPQPGTAYAAAPLSDDELYDALFGPLGGATE